MSAADLLRHLRAAGFDLTAADNKLMVSPGSRLTEGQRAELRVLRPELIALLTGDPADPDRAAPERPHRLTMAESDVAHADAWDEAACAVFEARARHMRRLGFGEQDAEDLAESLHLRDVHSDYRRLCVECGHYRPGRCGNHASAGLVSPIVGADLATMFQDCAGFRETSQ